jgi:hypothetical protein
VQLPSVQQGDSHVSPPVCSAYTGTQKSNPAQVNVRPKYHAHTTKLVTAKVHNRILAEDAHDEYKTHRDVNPKAVSAAASKMHAPSHAAATSPVDMVVMVRCETINSLASRISSRPYMQVRTSSTAFLLWLGRRLAGRQHCEFHFAHGLLRL